MHPQERAAFKITAFVDQVGKSNPTNFISFGDGPDEEVATVNLVRKGRVGSCKHVKLTNYGQATTVPGVKPTQDLVQARNLRDQLYCQLQKILSCFDEIVRLPGYHSQDLAWYMGQQSTTGGGLVRQGSFLPSRQQFVVNALSPGLPPPPPPPSLQQQVSFHKFPKTQSMEQLNQRNRARNSRLSLQRRAYYDNIMIQGPESKGKYNFL